MTYYISIYECFLEMESKGYIYTVSTSKNPVVYIIIHVPLFLVGCMEYIIVEWKEDVLSPSSIISSCGLHLATRWSANINASQTAIFPPPLAFSPISQPPCILVSFSSLLCVGNSIMWTRPVQSSSAPCRSSQSGHLLLRTPLIWVPGTCGCWFGSALDRENATMYTLSFL